MPGRANTAAPEVATPNHIGLPGRCATLWNTARTPSSSSTLGTRSKLAHRHAAAQDQHVVRLQVEVQPRAQLRRVVEQVIVGDALKAVLAQRATMA